MRLGIVYNKNDHKLNDEAYSQTYYSMFKSLIYRFDEVEHITEGCDVADIDVDVFIFFDIHSSHHIELSGIKEHKALKLEYFNDPHQKDFKGQYRNGDKVHKLGAKNRCLRALERGVSGVICPYKAGYKAYFENYLGKDMLWHFPISPDKSMFINNHTSIKSRVPEVLANGCTWPRELGCYDFRRWAFSRLCVKEVQHTLTNNTTPKGKDYGSFLSRFAGALALYDWYPIPKYFEIPLAGCVTFVQWHDEMGDLGFEHGKNCIIVDKQNFELNVEHFKHNIEDYQNIATAGRELIEDNYTSNHFADFVYTKCKESI